MMLFGKKAEQAGMRYFEMFQFMIILGICIFTFVMAMSMIKNSGSKVPSDLEYKLMIDRALFSSQCFAYQDETGRTHPQELDLTKFNNYTLKRCLKLGTVPYEFRFKIPITGKTTKLGRQAYLDANTTGWYGMGFDYSIKYPIITINATGQKEITEIEIQVKEVHRTSEDI